VEDAAKLRHIFSRSSQAKGTLRAARHYLHSPGSWADSAPDSCNKKAFLNQDATF
jgi:hypothetical protein